MLISFTGCLGAPRMRMGCLPTSTPGGSFLEPDGFGAHSYGFAGAPFEGDGIVYTCKAGHVDITHLRWNADYTKYLKDKTKSALMRNKDGFSFRIVMEQSDHIIKFNYPASWEEMPEDEKERIAEEISMSTGPYLAYGATTWHEILTWSGTHYVGFEPEENSAFSWEDSYSNLLGTHIAVEAMQDTENSYDKAMELGIKRHMDELHIQPRKVALAAAEQTRGDWFVGNFIVETKMKNFDIGIDGEVTPTIVPGVQGCRNQEKPLPLKTFNLDVLDKYGFEMTYQIKPNVFEAGKIYKIIGEKKVFPAKHYSMIIEDIKRQADAKGYKYDE
jgi:hypothetical protein